MGEKDICGATDTTSGEPCKFTPGDSCPWHDDDKDPNTRRTMLEQNPEVIEIIAGELQNEATVVEACAEAGLKTEQPYYDWRDRGREQESGVFAEFLEETTHARRVASRQDRRRMKDKCIETGDTRTWYKIHHDQYGDSYGNETREGRETGDKLRLAVPDELTEQWQQQMSK